MNFYIWIGAIVGALIVAVLTGVMSVHLVIGAIFFKLFERDTPAQRKEMKNIFSFSMLLPAVGVLIGAGVGGGVVALAQLVVAAVMK